MSAVLKLDGKTVTEGLKLAAGNERQGGFRRSPAQKAHPESARASRGCSASPALQLPEQRALRRLAGLQGDILLPHKTPILLLFKPSLCRCPLAFRIIAGASICAYSSSLINSSPFSSLRKDSSPSGKAVPPDGSFPAGGSPQPASHCATNPHGQLRHHYLIVGGQQVSGCCASPARVTEKPGGKGSRTVFCPTTSAVQPQFLLWGTPRLQDCVQGKAQGTTAQTG